MLYSDKFKEQMVRRMVGPNAMSANSLAKDVGVSQATLSKWLRASVPRDMSKKTSSSAKTPPRSLLDQARLVVEWESLSPEEQGAFLRREGLHTSDLETWRSALSEAAEPAPSARATKADKRKIRKLEQELRRKDKALAETAALLVLQKKAQAIWGDADDDTDRENGD